MDRTALIVRRFVLISHLLTLIVIDGTSAIIDH
jgi:competence protein ComGF